MTTIIVYYLNGEVHLFSFPTTEAAGEWLSMFFSQDRDKGIHTISITPKPD